MIASAVLPLLLLAGRAVFAQATTDSPSSSATPWTSVAPDGEHTVITPSGTVGLKPTATNTVMASSTTIVEHLDKDKNLITYCNATNTDFAPFCVPENNSTWWIGGDYFVTWDANYFQKNSTVKIALIYADYGNNGQVVTSFDSSAWIGFLDITPVKDWMKNQTAKNEGYDETLTNQTVYFSLSSTDSVEHYPGPYVLLTTAPKPKKVDPSKRPAVSTLGLAIGLPIMVVFIVGMVCCMHFCMRTRRQIGPIAIGGGRRHFRKRGYSGREARRMKATRGDHEADYRDEPASPDELELEPERHDQWELANVKGGQR